MRVVALAGGVGGAKLADGLARAVGAASLAVIVNTADDFELFGLRICPDLDTVLYTLAGLANAATGWGVAGDAFTALELLERYGEPGWFQIGDRDLATHVARTHLLAAGQTLTGATARLARALGVASALLPMTDAPVATLIETADGVLGFQDYFVRRHQVDTVRAVRFDGIERAEVPAGVRTALAAADLIVFCPSNPIVSIGPILAVPGMREALREAPARRVAVSPIVGGRALRGPADRMLASLGHEVSPLGVARLYQDVLDGFVVDAADAGQRAAIEALGLRVLVTDAVMRTFEDRRRLASEMVEFGQRLPPPSAMKEATS
ncbi:MAG TPA: 2-phospho-L-lactate transferase [Ktedonobacterales bacterium]|jgi:LPPG:FO 2-phospho-L-lactate transferase